MSTNNINSQKGGFSSFEAAYLLVVINRLAPVKILEGMQRLLRLVAEKNPGPEDLQEVVDGFDAGVKVVWGERTKPS